MMSNVTGAGLPQLKTLLNCLPTSQGGSKYLTDAPLEFSISDVFSVPFAGSVAVSLVILRGGMQVLR
jgi:GTPase